VRTLVIAKEDKERIGSDQVKTTIVEPDKRPITMEELLVASLTETVALD